MTFTNIFATGTFVCLGIFLFVSAPPKLPEQELQPSGVSDIGVSVLFNVANSLNEAARLIFTREIVGRGKQAGLEFGEDWDEPGVEKGPLPALFLRLVARQLERKPQPLGLYLGSDQPINKSNLFSKDQMQQFLQVKNTLVPKIDLDNPSRATAMYPDFATARPCVVCHNEHPDSPKTDWSLGDVMGATTWTYPKVIISNSEALDTSKALAEAIAEAYELYLAKTKAFSVPVEIGAGWPGQNNRVLPDKATFMGAVFEKAGLAVVEELLGGT